MELYWINHDTFVNLPIDLNMQVMLFIDLIKTSLNCANFKIQIGKKINWQSWDFLQSDNYKKLNDVTDLETVNKTKKKQWFLLTSVKINIIPYDRTTSYLINIINPSEQKLNIFLKKNNIDITNKCFADKHLYPVKNFLKLKNNDTIVLIDNPNIINLTFNVHTKGRTKLCKSVNITHIINTINDLHFSNLPSEYICYYVNDIKLDKDKTFKDYNINSTSIIDIKLIGQKSLIVSYSYNNMHKYVNVNLDDQIDLFGHNVQYIFNDRFIKNTTKFIDIGINNFDNIEIRGFYQDESEIWLKIDSFDTNSHLTRQFFISLREKIRTFMDIIFFKYNIPQKQQLIKFYNPIKKNNYTTVNDYNLTFIDYNISKGSIITIKYCRNLEQTSYVLDWYCLLNSNGFLQNQFNYHYNNNNNTTMDDYKLITPGYCFEYICYNKKCKSYNEISYLSKYDRYETIYFKDENFSCNVCKSKIIPQQLAFNRCWFKLKGEKNNKKITIEWTKVNDQYLKVIDNLEHWSNLKFKIKSIYNSFHDMCFICLDSMSDDNYVKFSCNHAFHVDCTNAFLEYGNRCPYCFKQLQL
jgi:hypothetical protein